ncbi:MAG: 2Fe-2S iron-sulfur cluster-binding protein, partial [Alphaproteobacteria bacterium]
MSTITHDRAVRELVVGRTIFEYADELSVEVPTSCQRNGRCHECVVEIRRGMAALSSPSEAESFLRGDFRLACQAEVISDECDIEFAALRRRPRILTTSPPKKGLVVDTPVRVDGGKVYYDEEELGADRGHQFGLAIDLGTTTVAMELVD